MGSWHFSIVIFRPHKSAPPLLDSLHALSIYVAAGITSFGWALCHFAGWDATPWLPLWFCAALLIYNADRLWSDPADLWNLPQRTAASIQLRGLAAVLTVVAAIVLTILPIVRRDWITLALTLVGALVSLNYSRPLLGFRFKDTPMLKTFFAPTIVAAALIGLPWIHEGPPASGAAFGMIALRAWTLLLFNMTLCDLRDIAGDRRAGIVSLPVALGEKRTRALLWLLLGTIELLALATLWQSPAPLAAPWRIVALSAPLYLGGILLAVRRPRSERFYEWWVEGILFLPALAILVARA